MLMTIAPTGRPAACSSATPSVVSCTGISSSRVTRCTAVCGERRTAITLSAWWRIGPTAREPGDLGVDVEEAHDAPGRRRVQDDRVVRRPHLLLLALDGLDDLAGEQHVAHAGRDRRREVDGAEPLERTAGAAQVVEHLEVLEQGLLGVDGEREHLAAAGRHGDLPLLVRQRRGVEELGDALPALDLGEQDPAAVGCERECERRRDRRLPGAAFAGDDVQAHPAEPMLPIMAAVIAVVVVLAVILLIAVGFGLRVVQQYERGVVFRLGRVQEGVRSPGLNVIVPIIDRMVRVNLQVVTLSVPAQDGITRDNVTVRVDAVVYFRVVDPVKAIVNVQNYGYAISQVAQTSLRSVIGKADLDMLLSDRERMNADLRAIIDEPTEGPWGVKIERVEIKDVALPESMKRSMSRQAEAERERRARVIAADGELQASHKLAEAAAVMSSDPSALQLRLLQTIVDVAAEKNSTLVVPFPVELLRFFQKMAEK